MRLSGQDSGRGTFSQRHSVWVDQDDGAKYIPLTKVGPARFEVRDSPLSEFGVLGFEYGWSLADPQTLVLWEAQFGDFANGAQVMIDQFIAAGEAKWLRASGLVLLLPHGYEGQGPEHSSARPERFLQLCAEDNMQVANCTTPANYFHILRRQMHRDFRKPLVIMTPKSLLRHKLAVSSLADFSGDSHFRRILSDPNPPKDGDVKRLVLCTGKVAYELMEARDKAGDKDIAIVRIEQLYPFPGEPLLAAAQADDQSRRGRLGAGRAEESGLLELRRAADRAVPRRGGLRPKRPLYAGRKAVGLAGHRPCQAARRRAGGADRRRARPFRTRLGATQSQLRGNMNGDRSQSADAWRIDHRGDARPVAQAARRRGRGRTSRSPAWRPTRSRSRCRRRSPGRWASSVPRSATRSRSAR